MQQISRAYRWTIAAYNITLASLVVTMFANDWSALMRGFFVIAIAAGLFCLVQSWRQLQDLNS